VYKIFKMKIKQLKISNKRNPKSLGLGRVSIDNTRLDLEIQRINNNQYSSYRPENPYELLNVKEGQRINNKITANDYKPRLFHR
jgi:hypothetical protein